MPLGDDAKRFQAWQLDAIEARPPGTQLLSIGPFRALLPGDQQGRSGGVTLVDGRPTERDTTAALGDVRSALRGNRIEVEIEYNATAYPEVGAWLEGAGLTLDRSDPLMACRPERFKPLVAPDVIEAQLTRGRTSGGEGSPRP